MNRLLLLLCCGLCCAVALPTRASIVTFGSGGNEFDMTFVEIGSPGNGAATNGAGQVDYVYNIGKFEVSRDMITKANGAGDLGITLQDMTSWGGNGANRPATGVSWNEAARFVNWLNTSEGHAPAYKFALQPGDAGYNANANILLWESGDVGYDATNPFRNSLAQYFLPSVDEWFKAAYYDPLTDTYGAFPTSNGTLPTAVASGTDDKTAVFGQMTAQGPADITAAGGLSAFGVMGMGGNVWEWEETEWNLPNDSVSSARGVRGGDWDDSSSNLSSSSRGSSNPGSQGRNFGFRVASLSSDAAVVPELSSLCVWALLGACGLWSGRRRLRK